MEELTQVVEINTNIEYITLDNIGDVEHLTAKDLQDAIRAKIDNFDATKLQAIKAVQLDTSINLNEQLVQISKLAQQVTPNQFGILQDCRKFALLDGKLYEVTNLTSTKTSTPSKSVAVGGNKAKAGAKFEAGQQVRFANDTNIYTVTPEKKLMAADGTVVNPSDIVCAYYDRPNGTMPGLSHEGWIAI